MSLVLGLALLLIGMGYAIYVVYSCARYGGFNYFGRRIAKAERPALFWFSLGVMLLILIFGARTAPLYVMALK